MIKPQLLKLSPMFSLICGLSAFVTVVSRFNVFLLFPVYTGACTKQVIWEYSLFIQPPIDLMFKTKAGTDHIQNFCHVTLKRLASLEIHLQLYTKHRLWMLKKWFCDAGFDLMPNEIFCRDYCLHWFFFSCRCKYNRPNYYYTQSCNIFEATVCWLWL